jgi:tetrahydromethanopterin S-methyltransferase subunit G
MSEASQYVTRQEFETVKEELKHLSIQVAVLGERMDARFEQVDARFEQVDARFEHVDARLEEMDNRITAGFAEIKQIIADNHVAVVSLLLKR